ncbi:MAG: hypothetical protein SGPRY_009894, partial [Prymnesium sp.]
MHASHAVRVVVSRLSLGTISSVYALTPADLYALEPCQQPAWLTALAVGSSPITFGSFADERSFLSSFGFFAFIAYGRCLSASRESAHAPVRSVLQLIEDFCSSAGLLRVNSSLTQSALSAWFQATEFPSQLVLLEENGQGLDRRELCLRLRHKLLYGSSDQKLYVIARMVHKEPLKSSTPSIQAVVEGAAQSDVRTALSRLVRGVTGSPNAAVADFAAVQSLESSLSRLVGCLSAPGMLGASVADKVDEVLRTKQFLPSSEGSRGGSTFAEGSSSLSHASASIYADRLMDRLGSQEWRRVEALLSSELVTSQPNPLRLMFSIMGGPLLSAKKLALGHKDASLSSTLRLSRPFTEALSWLKDWDSLVSMSLVCEETSLLTLPQSSFPSAWIQKRLRRYDAALFANLIWWRISLSPSKPLVFRGCLPRAFRSACSMLEFQFSLTLFSRGSVVSSASLSQLPPLPRLLLLPCQTAGRPLMEEESELRQLWICLIYLTLEEAGLPAPADAADAGSTILEEVRKKYRNFVASIVQAKKQ